MDEMLSEAQEGAGKAMQLKASQQELQSHDRLYVQVHRTCIMVSFLQRHCCQAGNDFFLCVYLVDKLAPAELLRQCSSEASCSSLDVYVLLVLGM